VRIAVIGTGLLGTSVAMSAARVNSLEVVGWDADPDTLTAASAKSGLTPAISAEDACHEADVVVVAVPVAKLSAAVADALAAAGENALITDVGSTKAAVVNSNADPRFVGGHPLAGAETGGPGAARADLFDGATWYLTPAEGTSGVALEKAFRLVSDLGAKPRTIRAETHDRLLATVSHLPHVLANLLVAEAESTLVEEGEPLPATGPSFRDATRVAGAPSSIWTDIYLANSEALIERLDGISRRLEVVRDLLEAGDATAITAWNDAAAAQKAKVASESASGGPARAIRVFVPNRPGVLAEIALALGESGIDLVDLQLHPAADRATGTIVLWIEGEDQLRRATELVESLGHRVTSR